ncbi:hypothetical protein C8Q75DRAFT_804406 [Abortiporus biennis]|nr:hypothetical protein C8Q75DRAFT_804406 [Abortiporus biennis]
MTVSDHTCRNLLHLAGHLPPTEYDMYHVIDDLLEENFPTSKRYIIKPQHELDVVSPELDSDLEAVNEYSMIVNPRHSPHPLTNELPSTSESSDIGDPNLSINSSSQVVRRQLGGNSREKPEYTVSQVDGRGMIADDIPILVVEIKLSSSKNWTKSQTQLSRYMERLMEYDNLTQIYGVLVWDNQICFYLQHQTESRRKWKNGRIAWDSEESIKKISSQLKKIVDISQEHPRYNELDVNTERVEPWYPERWLSDRAEKTFQGNPRLESKWNGVLRAILRHFWPITRETTQSHFTIKPEMLLRPQAAANILADNIWTDPYGQQVARRLAITHLGETRVDFGVCKIVSDGTHRIILLVELKARWEEEPEAFAQIQKNIERAASKLPGADKQNGLIFGMTICGGIVNIYELLPVPDEQTRRVLNRGDYFMHSQPNMEFGKKRFWESLKNISTLIT